MLKTVQPPSVLILLTPVIKILQVINNVKFKLFIYSLILKIPRGTRRKPSLVACYDFNKDNRVACLLSPALSGSSYKFPQSLQCT